MTKTVRKKFSVSERIHACWLGKNIGGTLGGPHEGKTGPLTLDYYDPVPDHVLPNDDLDLQIVWIHHLRNDRHQTVTPDILAQAWARHILWPPDEYGIVRRNDAYGIRGHQRGASDNYFAESMGAAIRSEVWACIAPGDPARAAAFAYADAAVDHCGDGIYAEIFHAALQSAAFTEQNPRKLIGIALAFLPATSRLKEGLENTVAWWDESQNWLQVRDRVVHHYATGNFTDVVCNLCFELIGWLAGGGDFGKSICIAVNCGFDTDCTGATLGALMGICDPDCISAKWRKPIGEDVVLSNKIVNVPVPRSLAELTDWTLQLAKQLKSAPVKIGPIVPRAPATAATGQPIGVQQVDADTASLRGADKLRWGQATLPGYWQQWRRDDFGAKHRWLRVPFTLQGPESIKLMAYYRPGITAWVDGREVIRFAEADLAADPFIAPSFHRARKAAHVFKADELKPGPHMLTLCCERPPTERPADLIFGMGDPATNFWLPDFFNPKNAKTP